MFCEGNFEDLVWADVIQHRIFWGTCAPHKRYLSVSIAEIIQKTFFNWVLIGERQWLVLEMLSRGNCRHWLGLITRKLDTLKSPIVHVVSQTEATCLELTAVTNILLDMQQFYIRSLHALQFMIEKIKIDIIKFRVQILSTWILSSFVSAFRRDILIIDKVWARDWNAP